MTVDVEKTGGEGSYREDPMCNQPFRRTQPPNISGMGNEYWPKLSAVHMGR